MLSKISSSSAFTLGRRSLTLWGGRNFSSAWKDLEMGPPDAILGLNEAFKKDSFEKKVSLGVGAYRDDKGKPYVLDCVRKATQIIQDKNMDHEYGPIEGLQSMVQKSQAVAFGDDNKQLKEGLLAGAQSLSGTGCLRLGMEFLAEFYPHKDAKIYIPAPSWPLHTGLAARSRLPAATYRYYDNAKKGLNLNGMLEDLEKAPKNSIVLYHPCAHNPTGCDPTKEEWGTIMEQMIRKEFMVFFDSAYQGFASGDLETDGYVMRELPKKYNNFLLSQSFAKNFGLYGERVGCLTVGTSSTKEQEIVMSRIKQLARPTYSNPPIHGARIVDTVLGDKALTDLWHKDLKVMSGRIIDMRKGLVDRLKGLGNQHDWSHITSQIGMFAYTGMTKEMVTKLREESHIYMTADARISISGLNSGNLDYVAEQFHKVTKDGTF